MTTRSPPWCSAGSRQVASAFGYMGRSLGNGSSVYKTPQPVASCSTTRDSCRRTRFTRCGPVDSGTWTECSLVSSRRPSSDTCLCPSTRRANHQPKWFVPPPRHTIPRHVGRECQRSHDRRCDVGRTYKIRRRGRAMFFSVRVVASISVKYHGTTATGSQRACWIHQVRGGGGVGGVSLSEQRWSGNADRRSGDPLGSDSVAGGAPQQAPVMPASPQARGRSGRDGALNRPTSAACPRQSHGTNSESCVSPSPRREDVRANIPQCRPTT